MRQEQTEGSYQYPGNELSLFQHAHHWKKYFSSRIKPYLRGDILEVGAGMGANVAWLGHDSLSSYTLAEPDDKMYALLLDQKQTGKLPGYCRIIKGSLENAGSAVYDCILYIDVLEHIENDNLEMVHAASLLKPGGHLIVLSPAFAFLYSPFDKAIGHYRRYSRRRLKTITPAGLVVVNMNYLDTIGFFASFANRLFLRQSYPSTKQVYLWDKWMVPVSTFTDRLFFHSFGKSILAIWQKNPD